MSCENVCRRFIFSRPENLRTAALLKTDLFCWCSVGFLHLCAFVINRGAIGKFCIETHVLQKADLLPTLYAPVVRSLKEHVWGFNFIRDANPQLAVLLVTDTFRRCFLKNFTFMHSDDFTRFCIHHCWLLHAAIKRFSIGLCVLLPPVPLCHFSTLVVWIPEKTIQRV